MSTLFVMGFAESNSLLDGDVVDDHGIASDKRLHSNWISRHGVDPAHGKD